MNLKAILNLFGILLVLFSFSFMVPIGVSLLYKDTSLNIFITTFLIVAFLGLIFWYFSNI